MLDEADRVERVDGVEGRDLGGALAGIDGEHDGDEAAHDMGVRIAFEGHDRIRTVAGMADEPDLAGAALHFVGRRALVLGEIGQRLAEFDDEAVAVLPFFQEGEVVDDLLQRGHGGSLEVCPDIGETGTKRNAVGTGSIRRLQGNESGRQ